MKKVVKLSALLVVLFGIIIAFFAVSFANLTENKKIEIFSETADYQNNEQGSWKLSEEGDWNEKGNFHVSLTLESNSVNYNTPVDIMFVTDMTDSMQSDEDLLTGYESFVNNQVYNKLLENENNTLSLLLFNDEGINISSLFSRPDSENSNVSGTISAYSPGINYNLLLRTIEFILDEYNNPSKKVEIIITSDSISKNDVTELSQRAQSIKQKYPNVVFDGISYKTDDHILKELESICDNNYVVATAEEGFAIIEDILFSKRYDSFTIEEYINTDDFDIDRSSIKTSNGRVSIEDDRIDWDLSNSYYTGGKETLEYDLIINEDNEDSFKMFYSNTEHVISSSVDNIEEEVVSDETLVLNNNYSISFSANTPSGCTVRNLPSGGKHHVGEAISLPDTEPTCEGYLFKGWKPDENNAGSSELEFSNLTYMPEKDVEYIATWSKLNVVKSLTGSVQSQSSLYSMIASKSTMDTSLNFANDEITPFNSRVYEMYSTRNDDYPVYYYHGAVEDNNVLFGDICWKIVRTTSTGGVKLIYNGLAENGSCDNDFATTSIGQSAYTRSIEDIAGYDENDEDYAEADGILEILFIALVKLAETEGGVTSIDDIQDIINSRIFPNAYMYKQNVRS